jgi:ribosomal-protein-alanine N-acetyltransferase
MIEMDRITIRKFAGDDLPWLVEMRADPEVNRFLGGARLQNAGSISKRFEFYLECYQKFGFGMSAMLLRETGEPLGWSGLQPLEESGEIEVGYGMARKFWRQGFGFECASAWLEHGFSTVGLERIVAVADERNTGSWKIMKKCGMHYEKNVDHYGMDLVLYSISREEFFAKEVQK